MLVLSRKINESIMIGDDIEVTIVDIKGDQIRIGIKAPKEVFVHRKEVFEAIKNENIDAASLKNVDLKQLGDLLKKNVKKDSPKGDRGLVSKSSPFKNHDHQSDSDK